MAAPEVFEVNAPAHGERELIVATAGLALMTASVAATFVLLPRGFGFLVVVVVFYPALQVTKRILAPARARAATVRIDDAGIEFGSALRFRWRDVVHIEAGTLVRRGGRAAPDRVKLRLNRLAPIQPTARQLEAAGLKSGDGYFDLAIPPVHGISASELAERFEQRRQAAR